MIAQEKAIFYREHGANAYSAAAWHFAWLIKMLLSAAMKMTLYPPAYYFPAQLRLSWTSYLVAAFLTGGMGFGGSATAMLVAAAIPSYAAATTTFTFLSIVYQNLCGFYISLNVIPTWIRWLAYLSIYKYAFEAFVATQVRVCASHCMCVPLSPTNPTPQTPISRYPPLQSSRTLQVYTSPSPPAH